MLEKIDEEQNKTRGTRFQSFLVRASDLKLHCDAPKSIFNFKCVHFLIILYLATCFSYTRSYVTQQFTGYD